MKNILLLSFYFPPYKGVGSKRADYWYKKMCNDKRFDITVLTAIPQTKKKKIYIMFQPLNINLS